MDNVEPKKPHFAYMISPRDSSVGGGWSLKLFEQGLEVGGGAFAAVEGEDDAQVYLDAMDEGESWLLAKAEHATGEDVRSGEAAAANSVLSEVDVQAEEARLYRELTGEVMALGFDGLVAAVETLRNQVSVGLSAAARDLLTERRRQVEQEGITDEGDDGYQHAELPRAAASYILNGTNDDAPYIWPWAKSWWKPRDARANYVRAGALILAEVERLDRAISYPSEVQGGEA